MKTNILCNHANYASGPWIPHPMATAPEVRFLQINARQPLWLFAVTPRVPEPVPVRLHRAVRDRPQAIRRLREIPPPEDCSAPLHPDCCTPPQPPHASLSPPTSSATAPVGGPAAAGDRAPPPPPFSSSPPAFSDWCVPLLLGTFDPIWWGVVHWVVFASAWDCGSRLLRAEFGWIGARGAEI